MAGKVEVRVKDGGHSITIEGKELRGDTTITVEETDYIKNLRKAGLIITKPFKEVEQSEPEPKVSTEPEPAAAPVNQMEHEVLPPVIQNPVDDKNKSSGKPGNGNRTPRNKNNRNRNTMQT